MILTVLYFLTLITMFLIMYLVFKHGVKNDSELSYKFRNRKPTVSDFFHYWNVVALMALIPFFNTLVLVLMCGYLCFGAIGNSKLYKRFLTMTI